MNCTQDVIVAVLVTVVVVILLCLLSGWAFWNRTKNNFFRMIEQANAVACQEAVTPSYTHTVTTPRVNGQYQQDLALALWQIDEAVSDSNCTKLLPIPTPPPFTHQLRLEVNDPSDCQLRMFAYIFWNQNGQACFSFTGTFFAGQWLDDFHFRQVPATKLNGYECGVDVHTGFYQIYIRVRCELWKWWQTYDSSIRELYISGHSLGGALSTLCAFDFADVDAKLIHYSFAAPRSGNVKYSEVFDQRVPQSLRIYNTEDIVVAVPLATFEGVTYQHTSVESGSVPFTKSLGSIKDNHIKAYNNYMPKCFDNKARCIPSYIPGGGCGGGCESWKG